MHHRMPPSKTWWPSLNVVILSPVMRLIGRPRTVTNREISDQIHELILEGCRILAKSIAEQLGISHEQVGSIIHEDLGTQKLSVKWVPKCLNTDQKRHNSANRLNNFWNFFGAIQMISCHDW